MSISQQSAAAAPADEERLYQATMQALDTPPKEASTLRKAGLLIGTLALSVLAFLWLDSTLLTLVAIVSVLLFHELGHYVGMRLFGYRDVRMFFIPFFGAAVSGTKYGVPVWQHATVLLLGPLPGLALAVALHWLYEPLRGNELYALVWMLTFINAFNLLPVTPLDGGRLVNALFFARQPYLAAGFQLLAGCALAGYAWLTSSWLLGLVGVVLLLGVTSTYYDARWGEALRADNLELPDEIERLNDEQRRLLFARAAAGVPQDQRDPARLAGNLRAAYEHMVARRPSLLTTALFMGLYLSGFAAAAFVAYRETPLASAQAADDRGVLASIRGKRDEALVDFRKALAIREAYLARYPTSVEGRFALSLSYDQLALESHEAGGSTQRLDYLMKVLAIREELAQQQPSVARWRYELSRTHRALAEYYGDRQRDERLSEAMAHLGKAIAFQQAAMTADWRVPLGKWWDNNTRIHELNLASLHRDAGRLLMRMGQPGEAVKHYQLSLSLAEKATGLRGLHHETLGEALAAAGNRAEAAEHLRKAITLYRQEIAASGKLVAIAASNLDRVERVLAPILLQLGHEAEALDTYRAALARREKNASEVEQKESGGTAGKPGPDTARALERVSWGALLARDFAKALAAAERSLSLDPGRFYAQTNRAHALLLLGRIDEAKAAYLARKGHKYESGATWEQLIAQDFTGLRAAGLAHAMMPEILKLLGPGE
jgi:tetratricopeptide (TPR) repeat protein